MPKQWDEEDHHDATVWYQVRWKADNSWQCSPMTRRKQEAYDVYHSWCAVLSWMAVPSAPCRLVQISKGVTTVLESNDA